MGPARTGADEAQPPKRAELGRPLIEVRGSVPISDQKLVAGGQIQVASMGRVRPLYLEGGLGGRPWHKA